MNTRTNIASCILGLSLLLSASTDAQDVGKGRDLRGKDFQNRDLRKEDLDGANLQGANLTAADMTDAVMKKANLKDANLSRAKLHGADLTGADLRGANLFLAGIQRANLSQANLEGLDLKGLSLNGCILRGANLGNTKGFYDITKADFSDADLRGANLSATVDYNGNSVKVTGARYDKNTKWPAGFNVEGSGAKRVETAATPTKEQPAKATTASTKKRKKGKVEAAAKKDDPAKPAAAKALDPNRPSAAPTEDEVKKAFEKQWVRTQVLKNTFTYRSMKFGTPREGDALQDGTPANVRTIVFPVTLICEQVVEHNNREIETKLRSQTFIFFKGDTGEWSSRSYLNN